MQEPRHSTENPGPLPVPALDERATVERLDPHGLLARIESFPE